MDEELNKYLEDEFISFCFCLVRDRKKWCDNNVSIVWVLLSHPSVESTF